MSAVFFPCPLLLARGSIVSGVRSAVFALSPTTMMYWQGLCLFHAAVLPLTLYGGVKATQSKQSIRSEVLDISVVGVRTQRFVVESHCVS